jgi:hypothetical protein
MRAVVSTALTLKKGQTTGAQKYCLRLCEFRPDLLKSAHLPCVPALAPPVVW